MNKTIGALGLVLALYLPAAAHAATIIGAGNPGGAVTGSTVEDFDSTSAGFYASLTFGNVTITGIGGPFTIGSDYNGQYNTSGGQSLYNDFDFSPLSFRFDFATAVEAFAFNWGAADIGNWTLAAYDAADNLLESFNPAPTWSSNDQDYYGIAASGIAYATLIATNGDYVFIDNFASTTVAAVPVPAAGFLLFGALGGLAALRRRKTAA